MKKIAFLFILIFVFNLWPKQKAAILPFNYYGVAAKKALKLETKFRQQLKAKNYYYLMSKPGMDWKFRKFKVADYVSGGLIKNVKLGKVLEVHKVFSGHLYKRKNKTLLLKLRCIDVNAHTELIVSKIVINDKKPVKLFNEFFTKKNIKLLKKVIKVKKTTSAAPLKNNKKTTKVRQQIIKIAKNKLGYKKKKFLIFRNKKFNFDCSGFVAGVYWAAGIDLFKEAKPKTSGSKNIFLTMQKHHKIKYSGLPQKGDVVFFNNTYDANHDQKVNDPLTHVGLVLDVLPNERVIFIHRSSKGITKGFLHLKFPKNRLQNSYLRRGQKSKKKKIKLLAGELFFAYGSLKE